jgi:hypothetical protein
VIKDECSGKGLRIWLENLRILNFATHTLVQHLHFFEKKSEKYKRIAKHITKNTKMVELGFKNDICIGMKFVLFVFSDKKKKKSKC